MMKEAVVLPVHLFARLARSLDPRGTGVNIAENMVLKQQLLIVRGPQGRAPDLGVLGVEAVKTVPLVSWSHPFVERLSGSLRREYLDRLSYLNTGDLEQKLELLKDYGNPARVHQGLGGETSEEKAGGAMAPVASLVHYRWLRHCHGLIQLPIAA